MFSRHDEERVLGGYKGLLAAEERKRAEVQQEIDRLKLIVKGIEERLQAHKPGEQPISGPALEPPAQSSLSVRNGRPTFASSVRAIMGDGVERDGAALLLKLHERGVLPADGDRKKQMQKISNTLVELTKQGDLERCGRGMYILASAEAQPDQPIGEELQPQKGATFAEAAGSLATGVAAGAMLAHAARTFGASRE